MASTMEIKIDYKQVTESLSDLAQRQVPFVVAKTLTALAGDAREHLVKRLPMVFDRPTPFTQRGVFTKPAQKATLTAEVYFPESQEAQGRATREYMRPGAQGASARNQKKTEFLLTRMGYLPAGWVTTPGSFIAKGHLDGYGNMPGSYYKQIIRSLGIKNTKGPPKPASGASQRRAARMGVEDEFFAITPGSNAQGKNGGWLPPGVWRRTGKGGSVLQQYLKFIRKASYKKRIDVLAEVKTAVDANVQRRWSESVQLVVEKFNAR